MRLLKENTAAYEPFYKSLQLVSKNGKPINLTQQAAMRQSSVNKQSLRSEEMLDSVFAFEKEIAAATSVGVIPAILKNQIKKIIALMESELFFFDDTYTRLIPFSSLSSKEHTAMVNKVYKEGIMDWIFETGKPTAIPEINNYTINGPKVNHVFFPIHENGKKKGVLSVITPSQKPVIHEQEEKIINLLLNFALVKIEKILLKEKLNKTYEELQTYQAKLSNDFRLSAIGELTQGIVEDIKSPLQVIMTYADLLEGNQQDKEASQIVQQQVKKINFVVNRLVKFSNINEEKIKIYPCVINSFISEFYELSKSSLESNNIECILDLEEKIPPILTHPTYVYQVLTNVMGLIKNFISNGGGIIFQTRYVSENILIKIVSTASISNLQKHDSNRKDMELNFKIIKNIMDKHEGSVMVDSFDKNSTIIQLSFPLRRKIRK